MIYYPLKLVLLLTTNTKTKNMFQQFPSKFATQLYIRLFSSHCKYIYGNFETKV